MLAAAACALFAAVFVQFQTAIDTTLPPEELVALERAIVQASARYEERPDYVAFAAEQLALSPAKVPCGCEERKRNEGNPPLAGRVRDGCLDQ